MWDHLILCYGGQQCKRPSKFPENKKVFEEMIESFRKQNVKFIGEFPSCSVKSNPQDVKYEGGSGHTFNSNTIPEYQEIRCVKVLKPIHELSKVIDDIYKLSRTSASEILVFMASDLNRSYNEELNNAHPIAYTLKGASMTNEVFTNMMQHVVEKCIEHGSRWLPHHLTKMEGLLLCTSSGSEVFSENSEKSDNTIMMIGLNSFSKHSLDI